MSNNKQCQFEASRQTSSATICKWCGREKWQHNTAMSNKQTDEQGKLLTYWGGLDNDHIVDANKKVSSIEWLQDKLNNVKPTEFCSIETIKEWVEQAKQMHKQQEYETKAFWFGRGILAHTKNRINELKPIRNNEQ